MWHGVPEYLAFVAIAALVLHVLVRRTVLACAIGIIVCSALNLAHEMWRANFNVNLGWAPIEFMVGCALALPVVAAIGIPFAWLRRERQPE